jgi:hypothetical protein
MSQGQQNYVTNTQVEMEKPSGLKNGKNWHNESCDAVS